MGKLFLLVREFIYGASGRVDGEQIWQHLPVSTILAAPPGFFGVSVHAIRRQETRRGLREFVGDDLRVKK